MTGDFKSSVSRRNEIAKSTTLGSRQLGNTHSMLDQISEENSKQGGAAGSHAKNRMTYMSKLGIGGGNPKNIVLT